MKSYTDKLFYINFFYVIPGIAFNVTKNNYFNLSNCPLFRNGKPVLIFFLKNNDGTFVQWTVNNYLI